MLIYLPWGSLATGRTNRFGDNISLYKKMCAPNYGGAHFFFNAARQTRKILIITLKLRLPLLIYTKKF